MKVCTKKIDSQVLIFPDGFPYIAANMQLDWYDSSHWLKKDQIIGESTGRHITWFIKSPFDTNGKTWVLRHYYRGGMISKMTPDRFIFTGLNRTRGFREVKLLLHMVEIGLPVPKAVGARINRKGLLYTADLLMEKIEAKDLVAVLSKSSLGGEQWRAVGKTIATFHAKGIYHADLNAHNVLLDDNDKVWLIDFDRCEKRTLHTSWQQQNMERLKRSFMKEKKLLRQFYFDEYDWQNLMLGYRSVI